MSRQEKNKPKSIYLCAYEWKYDMGLLLVSKNGVSDIPKLCTYLGRALRLLLVTE